MAESVTGSWCSPPSSTTWTMMWPGGRDEGLAWKSNSTFAQIRLQKEDQKLTEFEPAGVVARLANQHLLQVEGGGDTEQIFTNVAKYSTLSQKIKSFLIYSSSSHLDSVSGLLSRLPSILVEKSE